MLPSEKLKELDIVLPPAPTPIASYVAAVKSGNLLYISGQLPLIDGVLPDNHKGLADDIGIPDAALAARQAAINGLSIIDSEIGINNVKQIVRVNGYVASSAEFQSQSMVINGASDFLVSVFALSGKHTRVAVSAPSLPLGSVVELDMIVEFDNNEDSKE
jgi:enamine deaminase RidA (YjgF/YER057c/UK114 family)